MLISFLFFLSTSFVSSGSVTHPFAMSMKFLIPFLPVVREFALTYKSVNAFLFTLLLPDIMVHLIRLSALAFLACFLSSLLLSFCAPNFSGVRSTTLSLSGFVVRATFSAASSMIFCIVSRSSFCPSSFFIPHSLSEFNSCFISLWPPSCPFLLFPPRRKLMLSLILLYGRKDRRESHASISLCIYAFSDVLLGPTM